MSNPTIARVIAEIERYAPTALQEDYDNSGLLVGRADGECTGALIAFDVNEQVVAEASASGYNLIVAHHPLIFKGLKRLTGSSPVERAVMAALKSDIAVYAAHTNMDNAPGGVSHRMARMLGLTGVQVLEPSEGKFLKLATFVPHAHADALRRALFEAGAGKIGDYDCCSYSLQGSGTFRALDGANPFVGEHGEVHTEPETRIEVLLPSCLRRSVEQALRRAHPYEEPAYEFAPVSSGADLHAGSGAVGNLPEPMDAPAFIRKVKEVFGADVARCSRFGSDAKVSRVALCGGSGAFLINRASAAGADAFVTADIKYHDFADHAHRIILVDIGHFETEHCITSIFYDIITEKFPNFAVRCASAAQNPVIYL